MFGSARNLCRHGFSRGSHTVEAHLEGPGSPRRQHRHAAGNDRAHGPSHPGIRRVLVVAPNNAPRRSSTTRPLNIQEQQRVATCAAATRCHYLGENGKLEPRCGGRSQTSNSAPNNCYCIGDFLPRGEAKSADRRFSRRSYAQNLKSPNGFSYIMARHNCCFVKTPITTRSLSITWVRGRTEPAIGVHCVAL